MHAKQPTLKQKVVKEVTKKVVQLYNDYFDLYNKNYNSKNVNN